MKSLRTDWLQVKMGSLGDFRNGVNFTRAKKGSGLKLINVKDLYRDGPYLDFDLLDLVNIGTSRGIENYYVEKGDLFFARSSVKRSGIGQVCMSNRNDNDAVHCGFVIRFRPKSESIDSLFLTYLLRSQSYREKLISISGGSAIINITQSSLAGIELALPSITEQRVLSSILSAYDDLIENNRRRIQLLEEMARALYREWFVHFRFPGHEEVELVDSELGEIPEGWTLDKLCSVSQVNERNINAEFEFDDIQYVDISSVSTGQISDTKEISLEEAPSRAKRLVKHGDTIWSTVRPNRKSFSLILNPPENMVVSTGFAVLTPQSIPYSFLYQATTRNEFVEYLTNRATGSAYPAVSQEDFKNSILLLPPMQLLQSYHHTTATMFALKQSLFNMNYSLGEFRDILLPKLVSGQLDVSDLEIEMPPDTHKTSTSSDQSTLDQWFDKDYEEE